MADNNTLTPTENQVHIQDRTGIPSLSSSSKQEKAALESSHYDHNAPLSETAETKADDSPYDINLDKVSLSDSTSSIAAQNITNTYDTDKVSSKDTKTNSGNADENDKETHYVESQINEKHEEELPHDHHLHLHLHHRHHLPVGPPPNGGLIAWVQVLAGFFLFFNSWGIVNTFGVFQTYYKSDLLSDSSSSSISWIGSIQGFMVVNFSVIVGPLIDKGLARYVVLTGTFVLTFGMMMTSLGTEYYQILLAQGIVVGIGCSCAFVSSVAVISSYFSTKRGLAMGICASGSSLGGVIYPIMTYKLIPRLGFAWTARVLGFMIFGSTLIASLLLKPRLPRRKSGPLVHWPSLKDASFMALSFGSLFGFIGLYIPFFYIQTYAIQIGVERQFAFYLLSVMNAGSFFGRIIPNFMADKVGPFNVVVWCSGSCAILLLCWIRIKSTAGLTVFCVLYGFCSGAFVSVPPPCIASITPNLSIIGSRLGLSFFICGFGLLIGSPVGGAILKAQNETFWGTQLFAGLAMAISFGFCLIAKLRVGHGKFFVKC